MRQMGSFVPTRVLALGCLFSCAACGDAPALDQASAPADAAKLGSVSQPLDDPDGLLTPSFVTTYIPYDLGVVMSDLKKLAGFYSDAKTALAVADFVGVKLGLWDAKNGNEQFDKLQATIVASTRGVDWKMTAVAIDTWRGPAKWAFEDIVRGVAVHPGDNIDDATGSAAESVTSPLETIFYRAPSPLATAGGWQEIVPDRAQPDPGRDGWVYDWRLGVPVLMEIITYRIHAIAAMNPNFKWDDSPSGYKKELRQLRSFAQLQRDKMLAGIRCVDEQNTGRALARGQVCADINTGIYAYASYGIWPTFPSGPERAETRMRLRSQLYRGMPLFQLQSLIDTLTLYINGTQDLTLANADIRVAADPSLCLDIRNGDPTPGTPLWTWPCTGNVAQYWQYDRPSGRIYNPAYGQCLDVLPRERVVQDRYTVPGIKDGAQVVTNWCDDTGGQQWTYDPDSQTLQNAFGVVASAAANPPSSAPLAQAPVNVFAGPPHAGFTGEQWGATQRVVGKHAAPLFRYPDGGLHAFDAIWSTRYRDVYIGAADPTWQAVGTGDFNADHQADILWRNETYSLVSTWLLDSQQQPKDFPPLADHAASGQALTGDLDGNGVSDIVWTYGGWQASGSGAGYFANTTTWYMNATSTEPSWVDIVPSTEERVVAVGNFDGDAQHVADRIYLSKDEILRITLGSGESSSWYVGDWQAMGVGDFNADGTDDVLFFEPTQSAVFVIVMVNGRPTPSTILGNVPPSSGWTLQGAGDIDGDGVCDIIWRHTDGTVGYWLMNDASSVREYPTTWVSPDITFSGVLPIEAQ